MWQRSPKGENRGVLGRVSPKDPPVQPPAAMPNQAGRTPDRLNFSADFPVVECAVSGLSCEATAVYSLTYECQGGLPPQSLVEISLMGVFHEEPGASFVEGFREEEWSSFDRQVAVFSL